MEDTIPANARRPGRLDRRQAGHAARVLPCRAGPDRLQRSFRIRRAAQGIVKILFEARWIALSKLFEDIPRSQAFYQERIQFYLRDVRGYAYDEVNAALAAPLDNCCRTSPTDGAVHHVRPTSDFEPLAASFKRIKKSSNKQGSESGSTRSESAGPRTRTSSSTRHSCVCAKQQRYNASYREKLAAIASLRPARGFVLR